jgi:hypothetical protein
MTVNTDLDARCARRLQTATDDGHEANDVSFRWRNVCGSGEFMVGYACVEEGCWIAGWVVAVRHIDYMAGFAALSDQVVGRTSSVGLLESLGINKWGLRTGRLCTFIAQRGEIPMRSETLFTLSH